MDDVEVVLVEGIHDFFSRCVEVVPIIDVFCPVSSCFFESHFYLLTQGDVRHKLVDLSNVLVPDRLIHRVFVVLAADQFEELISHEVVDHARVVVELVSQPAADVSDAAALGLLDQVSVVFLRKLAVTHLSDSSLNVVDDVIVAVDSEHVSLPLLGTFLFYHSMREFALRLLSQRLS